MERANRPHYHVWLLARGGRIFYKLATPYGARQSAQRAAKKRQRDAERRMIVQCWERKCAPRLD